MGDLFSNQQSKQETTNSQVGVQGGTGVGAGAVAPGAGASGSGVISGSNVAGSINITTSDIEALHLVDNTTHDALASNTAVTTQAINASYNIATNALATLQTIHADDSVTTHDAVQTAENIAGLAAPQSPAAQAEITGGQAADTNKQLIIAIAATVILGLSAYFYNKV